MSSPPSRPTTARIWETSWDTRAPEHASASKPSTP
jgi:hypothetical protein